MAELINNSGFLEFTVEDLKTTEGVNRLNTLIRQLAQNIPSDGESVKIYQGYGTPEASVTAGVGAIYMRLDGSAGTAVYMKQTGSGNTGWTAVPGGGGGFGDVVGPSSATNNAVAVFDGTTGKLIKDSGLEISGNNTGDQLIFKTIAVSGQSDIVADTTSDTLTIAAGSGVTLTTNSGTDTLTIASSPGVTGSGTDNHVARWNGTGAIQDSTNVYIDDSGNVGIGNTSPSKTLHVTGTTLLTGKVEIGQATGLATALSIVKTADNSEIWEYTDNTANNLVVSRNGTVITIGPYDVSASVIQNTIMAFRQGTGFGERMRFTGDNITIGSTSAPSMFNVGDSAQFQVDAKGRILPRVTAATDATSITPTGNESDITTQDNTQVLGNLTINAPTGTPVNGQKWILRIKSTNVQTFIWNGIYRGGITIALPTVTSGATLTDYLEFRYNSADSKWDIQLVNLGY